jgi:PPK2 family polyphosphate:nucleotide phosphotransferase
VAKPDLLRPFLVTKGGKFRLRDYDPGDTAGLPPEMKERTKALLQEGAARMAALQARLYAQNRWGLLLIFQAMDAAGKDGAIEHVMSGVNPQGCQVHAFKAPSLEELDHDYLWRSARALPERGRIGIFNRSYYEEVLIVRVHPGILAGQHLPPRLVTKKIWRERLEDIAAHERYLSRNGYVIRKFFLHVSRAEQKRRFLARIERP